MSQTGVVDFSVGALVWIKRRNGSWWPGKIVGPEELSDGHLVSPARSGTPVQLLGKEDASVDWYNLEKSKRVKPFRCGEFDDCIERAESSHGMLPKKREKYARREDAILHALEIEKKFLGGKYGKLGGCSNSNSSKPFDLMEKALVSPSECCKDIGKCVHPKSHLKKLDLSIEDKTMDHPLHAKKIKEGTLLVMDEDNSEIMPRMRGLQNVGLKISHLKRKLASSVGLNGSRKPGFDNNAENTVHANNTSYLDQGMKSNEVLASESLVRRRDGRSPFDQVLQSTAYLQLHHSWRHDNDNVPMVTSEEEQTRVTSKEEHTRVTYRAKRGRFVDLPRESSDFSDDKQFCTNQIAIAIAIPPSHFEENNCPDYAALDEVTAPENTETDSSETDSVDSDADEEIAELPDAAPVTGLEVKPLRRSGTQVSYGSTSSEEPDDLVLTSDVSHLSPRDPVGLLKWKLKGKRNNCVISKRSNDLAGRRVFMSSMHRTDFEERESNAWGEPDLTENNFRRSGALTSEGTPKGLDDFTHTIIDWEDFSLNDHLVVRRYWEEDSSNYFDPALVDRDKSDSRMKSMLVDVDLKVRSSYQREHVPLISLMSKLNGKAIVGHPIQIEALEDGAAEILLSVADGIENNGTEELPVGRTARRTAEFPVQSPNPLAELDGEDNGHKAICCPLDRRYSRKQPKKISSSSRKKIKARRYSRKQPKKISLSSSKKIKALSSIGKDQKLRKDLKGVETFQAYGLIKGESAPTAVACIPVKLVFSRLYEELVGQHQ